MYIWSVKIKCPVVTNLATQYNKHVKKLILEKKYLGLPEICEAKNLQPYGYERLINSHNTLFCLYDKMYIL